jgi:hypothetical protein
VLRRSTRAYPDTVKFTSHTPQRFNDTLWFGHLLGRRCLPSLLAFLEDVSFPVASEMVICVDLSSCS